MELYTFLAVRMHKMWVSALPGMSTNALTFVG